MSMRPQLTRRRKTVPVAVVLGAALLLPTAMPAGAAPDPSAGPVPADQVEAPVPEIDWTGCGEGLEVFECASVQVPTDYDDPTGATTTIALTRLPARDPEARIGTLFNNPGGPGGSGVDFIQTEGPSIFDDEVYERFDVLGFDPRGVSRSDPATCYDSAKEETAAFAEVPAFPVTEAETTPYISAQLRFAGDCRRQSRDRFAHGSTANVARDMDLLRQAVGDEQLTYAGYSYGTVLGATYSALFPDRVRALSVEGVVLPEDWFGEVGAEDTSIGVRTRQGAAADETFTEFVRLCTEAGPEACSLAGLGDPEQVAQQTLERLRTEPVTVTLPDGTPLEITYATAVSVIFQSLYDPSGAAALADLITQLATAADATSQGTTSLDSGPAAVLERAAPDRPRRGEDYASLGGAQAALCADTGTTGRPFDYPDIAAEQDALYPHFGAARAWSGITCEFLRITDEDAYTGPWEQQVRTPVLVTGVRFDPATPYAATQPYADQFPDASVLTIEGYGHTLPGTSTCADDIVADYLIDLDTPAEGATCEQDRSPFDPPEPGAAELPRHVPGLLPSGS